MKYGYFSRELMKWNIKSVIVIMALLCVLVPYYLVTYKQIPFRYDDEMAWIGRGYFFDLLVTGNFDNALWQSELAYNQPQVGNYYYALLFYSDYLKLKNSRENYDFAKYLLDHNFYRIDSQYYDKYRDSLPHFIDWNHEWTLTWTQTVKEQQEMIKQIAPYFNKTLEMVYKARLLNVIIVVLTGILIFLLTKKISNTVIAFYTTLIWGTNYLIISYSFLAQADGLYNFFFVLSLYLLLLLAERLFKLKHDYIVPLFSLMIVLPLIAQTKLNGLMMLFFTYLTLGTIFFINRKKKTHNMLPYLISFLTITAGFFLIYYLINPFLYKNPLQNSIKLYSFRVEESQRTAEKRGGEQTLFSPHERISSIYKGFLISGILPCKFTTPHFLYSTCLNNLLLFKGVYFGLFVTGSYYIVKNILKKKHFYLWYFVTCFIFLQIMMSLYLMLNWDRYYIQLVYFVVFIQIYGFFHLLPRFIRNISNV